MADTATLVAPVRWTVMVAFCALSETFKVPAGNCTTLSSSKMVTFITVRVPSTASPPGVPNRMEKDLVGSTARSFTIITVMGCWLTPTPKVSVPGVPVKSGPLAAEPLTKV